MRSVWERWTKIVPVFYIPSCKAGAPLSACVVCLQTIHMHSSLEPVRFGSRFFCLCGDTRNKIVAIQIALFSACVDTRKNSRDLNRDSNRAFLVCGNAPNVCLNIAHNRTNNLTIWLSVTINYFHNKMTFGIEDWSWDDILKDIKKRLKGSKMRDFC